MEPDISMLRKTGHFYFALTGAKRPDRLKFGFKNHVCSKDMESMQSQPTPEVDRAS